MVKRLLLAMLCLSMLVISVTANHLSIRPHLRAVQSDQDQEQAVTILLNNGESVRGQLSNFSSESIRIQTPNGIVSVNLNDIDNIILDSSIPLEEPTTESINVLLRTSVSQARQGQTVLVAVYALNGSPISRAHVTLRYDPNILQLNQVRDGGLFRLGGVQPILEEAFGDGLEITDIMRPVGTPDVNANGQMLIYIFEAVGIGDTNLSIDPGQTRLSSAIGVSVPITITNTTATVVE